MSLQDLIKLYFNASDKDKTPHRCLGLTQMVKINGENMLFDLPISDDTECESIIT